MEVFTCDWTTPEPYECEQCQFETFLKVDLHNHIRTLHEKKETNVALGQVLEEYRCENCHFRTFSVLVLTRHDKICTQGWEETVKDVLEAPNITPATLPEKSKTKYEQVYKTFMDWRSTKQFDSLSENVLLAYFLELSEKYKSSSLWSQYSMLRATININNNINIENYVRLRSFLKRKGEGYRPKKAKTFTPDEINKFLNEAPDHVYLATKVASIMGIMGACRGGELHSINIEDVQDLGSTILVTVPKTKTKLRNFTITGHFYQICKQYIDLRPTNPKCSTSFFLNYQNGKCTIQRIGINKFRAMGKQIAKFLNLPNPEMYTGFSFRRSSTTVLVDTGGDITALERHTGWKSSRVAWGYIDNSMKNKIDTANKFIQSSQNTSTQAQKTSAADTNVDTTPSVTFSSDALEADKVTLPEKSKTKYEMVYKIFMDWRSSKKLDSFSEDVLLKYFGELSEKYKSSSLWSHYSMLRATLSLNNNINIENYPKLRSFLKRQGEGYQAKKAKTFTPDEINKFLNEAPDEVFLATKVTVIMRVMGDCRRSELHSMNIDDVQDLGSAILVTVLNTDTKVFRQFTITGHFYQICKKYTDLRPTDPKCGPSFFLNYQNGKCTIQKIGKNKFGVMGKQIARFLNLPNPEQYTGHSFPRSSESILLDQASDIAVPKTVGGVKSTTATGGYKDVSMQNKINTTNNILQSVHQNSSIRAQSAAAGVNINSTLNDAIGYFTGSQGPVGWMSSTVTEGHTYENEINRQNENLQSLHQNAIIPPQNPCASDSIMDSTSLMNYGSCSENDEAVSPEGLDASRVALPEKSRPQYEAAYKAFMDWRSSKNLDSFSENVLLAYFGELSEKKFKSSSLWSRYSMLRATLSINNGINIENYPKLRTLLKRQGKGYKPKKAEIFTPEEINKFLIEAPDNLYLATKVASIMGIMGACRGSELHSINIEDVRDLGSTLLVTIPNTDAKDARKFTITGSFYRICKKYIDLRPTNPNCTNSFFLNYQNGKCTVQRIGINKFRAMGKQIAKFLNLPNPEMYTALSFRRSSLLVNAGDTMKNKIYTAYYENLQAMHQNTSIHTQNASATDADINPTPGDWFQF